MVAPKVIVSVVLLFLVVGVAIGFVATVNLHLGGDKKKNDERESSAMNAMTAICAPTDYKDACERSLAGVATNDNSTPKDFVLAAIKAAKDEVQKSLEIAASQKVDPKKDERSHRDVEECKKLLGYAIEDLEFSLSTANKSIMEDQARDVLNWLTAVHSFQEQCVGTIEKPEYRNPIKDVMVNSTQLTANALAIVAQITEIAEGSYLGQQLSNMKNSRKLLEIGHDDDDGKGYPAWFPATDRKLLALPNDGIVPDVVVAKDGSGQFTTINQAVSAYPKTPMPHGKRFIIHVKAGIYDEQVLIARNQGNVLIYGDGPLTVVTGRKNNRMNLHTPATATFAAEGRGFIARGMTFRNTAGPEGKQAVALRVMSDHAVIFKCNIEGYQDTLLYQNYRQFYRDCVISGTIDFIFGMGAALIQNSEIIVRRPEPKQNTLVITADGKLASQGIEGLVIQNSRIAAEAELFPDRSKYNVYLGRPWYPYATTVIMESDLGDLIHPEGYMPWPKVTHEETCNYVEFGNRGGSAVTDRRVKWSTFHGVREEGEDGKYTAGMFIDGERWLKSSGVPFNLGFTGTGSGK